MCMAVRVCVCLFHRNSECNTHAHQQSPSYQSAKQSNGEHINTSETVEYALSKGKATEIGTSHSAQSHCRINNNNCCNNNNTLGVNSQQSADSNVKGFTNKMSSEQNHRDRLGLWGHDSEVAGAVSGLDRLRLSRFNKVWNYELIGFGFGFDFDFIELHGISFVNAVRTQTPK